MRLFLAFLVTALAAGGALAIYSGVSETYREGGYLDTTPSTSKSLRREPGPRYVYLHPQRPTWAAPVALFLAIAGIGGGVGIAANGRR